MNLIAAIGTFQKLAPHDGSRRWFSYRNETPRHCFASFCRAADHGDLVVLVSIRDNFAPPVRDRFLALVDSKIEGLSLAKVIDKLSNPVTSDYGFDGWIALGPAAHNSFKAQDAAVNARTVVCCPIYNCEFDGTESAEEIKAMRSDFVDTVDWNREPSPKLRMRFENPKTGGGSEGTALGLARPAVLFQELAALDGVARGWIEILNFRGDSLRIESRQPGRFVLLDANGNRVQQLDTNSAIGFLKKFLGGR